MRTCTGLHIGTGKQPSEIRIPNAEGAYLGLGLSRRALYIYLPSFISTRYVATYISRGGEYYPEGSYPRAISLHRCLRGQ